MRTKPQFLIEFGESLRVGARALFRAMGNFISQLTPQRKRGLCACRPAGPRNTQEVVSNPANSRGAGERIQEGLDWFHNNGVSHESSIAAVGLAD